jgi:thiol-disulfide isomerase/thioredoxin
MTKKKRPTRRPASAAAGKSAPAGKSAVQQRLAAQRAMAAASGARAQRRRRLMQRVVLPIGVVVLLAAVLVIVKVATGDTAKSGAKSGLASAQVVSDVTTVPASVFDTVGKGTSTAPPAALSGAPLTSGGKPEILYIGAEWCPFCATERWAVAAALARFGTFHDLGTTSSSPTDTDPNTQTLSFHGATYTSKYLTFVGKEVQSNQVRNGKELPLDTLTASEQSLFSSLTTGFPFVDVGGKYWINNAQYDPSVLSGKSRAQIAAALSDPNSAIAKGAIGAANVITAAICKVTKNAPSAVCTSAGVTAGATALPGGSGT